MASDFVVGANVGVVVKGRQLGDVLHGREARWWKPACKLVQLSKPSCQGAWACSYAEQGMREKGPALDVCKKKPWGMLDAAKLELGLLFWA